MNDWLTLGAFMLSGAMFALTLLGLGVAAALPLTDRWSKRWFIVFFTILLIVIGVYFTDLIVYQRQDLAAVERAVAFSEFLFTSALMIMPTPYLLHCCGEGLRKSRLFLAVCGLWGVFLTLLVASQFTGFIYSVTPDNIFIVGDGFMPTLSLLTAVMVLNVVGVIRRRRMLTKRTFIAFLVYLVPMTAAMTLHAVVVNAIFIDAALVVCAVSMFAFILSDQVARSIRQQREILRQQREIANQRAGLMVLQMRPHFIYNTMMSIYYLCEQDPQKAQQVTLDFTTYLRRNFTAVASDEPIPFSEELEHTRAYLAVEQARFDDKLFVTIDAPATRFRLPPLTLQPLVENAVKHGMDPDGGALHISIRTRETASGMELCVEDDGPGVDPADDGGPHVALGNIRQRLEMTCGGTLEIAPRKGGGTTVRVKIPH